MAIQLVRSGNGGNPGPNLGAAPTPGNLLVVQHASQPVYDAGGPLSGWHDLFGAGAFNNFVRIAPANFGFGYYWRIAQAGDLAQWPGSWGTDFWIAGEFTNTALTGPLGGVASIRDQAPPATDHYHLAFNPTGTSGELLVIGAGVSGLGTKGLETPDAGYIEVGSHDYGGAGKIQVMVYKVDPSNAGAYDPGFHTTFLNNWGFGSFAWAGAPASGVLGGDGLAGLL